MTGKPLTIISYGGGVQSTAMLVLAAEGRLGYTVDAALFANVGDDSEHPATLDFIRNTAIPWAAERGITVHELRKTTRDGTVETVRGRILKERPHGGVSDTIPVYTPDGVPLSRACTADFKIRVLGKWLKANGATVDNPATVCVGISTDEIQRANRKKAEPYESTAYPLIDLGLDRSRCASIIAAAGLPVPPKSSCYFCPFHRPSMWAEMRRDEPALFESSCALEEQANARRAAVGKEPRYLTRFGIPLREAVEAAQDTLPGFGAEWPTCDEGACWT